ncbi:TrkH family potassium uptake protein [Vacuolonema iberomarrocanum]|uniref:TrkH family potassium uptake protein n=1 Tax=Vacuolonema iberomarrocanum TaxID=3454632 RepID=UPI0019F399CC|nr:potassium transporter KtrB [filamentous cyanobacterium LEGE 07170]
MNKPTRVVLLGYASYILLTWVLLCLPVSWQSTPIGPLDNLFIATSAISTTGLVTVNTPDAYSFFGEFIIACAFQVGGLGYMTLGSFVILARERNLSSVRQEVGETVFSLPERFSFDTFIRHTIIFTALIEIAGFIGLYIAFSLENVPNAFWAAAFHSISAFCTAGFSVFPDSLMGFRDNFLVNFVVTVLSLFGAIGFIVVSDAWLRLTGRRSRITLTTKIILYATFSVIVAGWIFLFFADSSIVTLPLHERFLSSGFQAMTAMTTVGFNTHPIEELRTASVMVMLILMVIGASPSGTGGGLKTTSLSAAIGVVWASLRGWRDVVFLRRRIPSNRILGAFAALVFYLGMFLVGSILLLMAQGQTFEDVVFEAASALGTVGLSRGITGDLVPFGKFIVIGLMFIGRVGPITFGLALFTQSVQHIRLAKEDIAI